MEIQRQTYFGPTMIFPAARSTQTDCLAFCVALKVSTGSDGSTMRTLG